MQECDWLKKTHYCVTAVFNAIHCDHSISSWE